MTNRRASGADRRAVLTVAAGALLAAVNMRQAFAQNTLGPAPAPVPPAPRPAPVRHPLVHTPLSARQTDILVRALADAETHGFRRNEFVTPELAQLIHDQNLQDPHAQDLLKSAILDYAHAQRGQRITPSSFPEEWAVRPAPYDPEPEFVAAVSTDRLGSWLDSLPPRYEGYQALRRALTHYRALKGWKTIPDGAPLKPGAKDPRVAALRARLLAETPLQGGETALPAKPKDPKLYDTALTQAVQAFQRRSGLYPDGIVGPPTLAALNAPLGQRVLQIEANMERWRWLPRELPATRVQVNIAAAVLAVYRDGEPAMAMKAVAGKPADATPMLTSQIQSIVLNPPWHVPDSIAKKEIWPKASRDKGYLARNQFITHKGDDGVVRLIQKAGTKSALGRFKFDFPNSFGVYLHDTPAQSGFSRTSRLASHGCVRLEQPKALAALLLQDDQAWPEDRIDQVVAGDKTIRATLPQQIPLFILYWTAFVDNAGAMEFRPDAYDWDRKLLALIGDVKGPDSPSANLAD
ncbi:MAG: L,D-transpeptidase family protein [Caulobacteraceae bacterium]